MREGGDEDGNGDGAWAVFLICAFVLGRGACSNPKLRGSALALEIWARAGAGLGRLA